MKHTSIHKSKICSILMRAAEGIAAVSGFNLAISDLCLDLSAIPMPYDLNKPYYIAIREMGSEGGEKEDVIEACKVLGNPLVIAKITASKVCDYGMDIKFVHYRIDDAWSEIENEFNF